MGIETAYRLLGTFFITTQSTRYMGIETEDLCGYNVNFFWTQSTRYMGIET